MKKYCVTSNYFLGELIFTYDFDGNLKAFDIDAELSPTQRDYFFGTLPKTITELMEWPKRSKTMKILELKPDLTFATFYKKYNCTYGDKKEAEKLWGKLSDTDRTRCHLVLPHYDKYLQVSGIAKIYLERFIKKQYYNNDYRNRQ